jgi:hypothetical protein
VGESLRERDQAERAKLLNGQRELANLVVSVKVGINRIGRANIGKLEILKRAPLTSCSLCLLLRSVGAVQSIDGVAAGLAPTT